MLLFAGLQTDGRAWWLLGLKMCVAMVMACYGHAQNIPSRVQLLSFRGGRSDLDGHWSCRKCVLRMELMGWRPCAASSSMEVTDGITVRSFVEGIGLEYLEVVVIIPSSVD